MTQGHVPFRREDRWPRADYVKVVGTEQVWDNLELVNEERERRRNAIYGQPIGQPSQEAQPCTLQRS